MLNMSRNHISKILVGFSVVAATQVGLTTPTFGQYQGNAGDIVVIGNSPAEWSRFRSFWRELIQATPPSTSASSSTSSFGSQASDEPSPEEIEAKLKKNLVVSNLKFQPIVRLNGSSQVEGSLTNKNKKPVTVNSVAFEVVDSKGNLVRSGSAQPQPSNLSAGQTVTFSADLLGLAADSSYKVRLTQSPFVLQGGV